jgi:putative tryptophan/tyrosine transport system substrate-binding protein
VIAAMTTPAAIAAKQVSNTVPIVFELGIDPVAIGLVVSLNRPGGNVTGVSNLSLGLISKRVELVHQVVPDAKLVAVLVNPNDSAITVPEIEEARAAQTQLGIQLEFLSASTTDEIDSAFTKLVQMGAGALVVSSQALFIGRPNQIAVLATRHGVPAIHPLREFVAAGGLMSYGSDFADAYRLAGLYVGRILNGEKPGNLPVQQATKVEFLINLTAAKALGVTVPLPLLGRADEVIE